MQAISKCRRTEAELQSSARDHVATSPPAAHLDEVAGDVQDFEVGQRHHLAFQRFQRMKGGGSTTCEQQPSSGACGVGLCVGTGAHAM